MLKKFINYLKDWKKPKKMLKVLMIENYYSNNLLVIMKI